MKYTPPSKKFGELLVQHGFVTQKQLKEALHHQETMAPHKPLGEICVDLGFISIIVLKVVLDRYRKGKLLGKVLLDMGALSVDQLSKALSEQKRTGNKLGRVLLEKRFITKEDLAEALSIQLGIPKIVPNSYMIDQTLISSADAEYFRSRRVVPLSRVVTSGPSNKEIVTVIMENPLDMTTLAELEKVFNAEIRPAVSGTIDLDDFLHEVFDPALTDLVTDDTDSPHTPSDQGEDNSCLRDEGIMSRVRLEDHSAQRSVSREDALVELPEDRRGDPETLSRPPDAIGSVLPDADDTIRSNANQDRLAVSDIAPIRSMGAKEATLERTNQGDYGRKLEADLLAETEASSLPPAIAGTATAPDVSTTGDVVITEPAEDSPSVSDPTPAVRMRLEEGSFAPRPTHGAIVREHEVEAADAQMRAFVLSRDGTGNSMPNVLARSEHPVHPMTEPAEDSPSVSDPTPAVRMRLEEGSFAPKASLQNIARQVEQDQTAEAEVLSSTRPHHAARGQEPDAESLDPERSESKTTPLDSEFQGSRRPRSPIRSKMSDLTRPSNRFHESEPPSPALEERNTEKEPERENNWNNAESTSRPDEPRDNDRSPAPTRTSDKWSDLGVQEDIELSAPSKAMVIEEADCDASESRRNAVTILNSIVFSAVQERASDIHIEPLEGKLCVRYRIDGVMRHQADLPKAIAAALTTRIKVLSGLDIAERRRHQDGRIEARIGGRDIDLRVSTYASLWGENVVVRILNRETALVDIDRLGFSPLNLMRYLRILAYPAGVMLVTGPTGSGKTTTLYASLMCLRDTGIKIITVEDPIEYTIDGVVQGRLDSRPDLSYEDFIKSMMRQDPDVIMIGEIRDAAGAAAAMQASLTGHKVLTSFHTDDTVSAVLRLMDMDIQPFLISSTIAGITAQRLVRTLCPFCRELAKPEKSLLKAFTSIKLTDIEAHTFYRAVGCPRCAHTGYQGRTGVHELLEITEPLKEAILARKTASQMRLIARESAHLISMAEDGFYKAAQGITTLEEVLRLVFIQACDASVPYHAENLMAYCHGADDTNVLQLPKAHVNS